jgi:hypothetical protein|tara:strand:- start:371 stop:544 length:174 start_codon:yes stop_codon:yes gene_type:complete
VLDEIYYLVKYGNFTHKSVYNMPIFERRYYLGKLLGEFEKKNEAREQAKNKARNKMS